MFGCDIYVLGLSLVGILYLFFFLLDSCWSIIQTARSILAPYLLSTEETPLTKKYGQWALITGSTDGIGKAYAAELAERGINIVLVSRSEEKLRNVAKELESTYSVKTKIIAADFSQGPKAIEIIKEELGSLEIGILVNNVGKNYDYPMYLGEVPEKVLWDVITINVGAVTLLSRMFIEDMRKRGRGAIVNISSGSELLPLPFMTVYAATKAYIKSFTAAIRYEYSGSGITIQHVSPMFINTKMNHYSEKFQKESIHIPSAESFAKYAVATLGVTDNTTGYWSHGIQYFLGSIPPVWIRMIVGGRMNKVLRRDYFRKINQKKQENKQE